MRRPGVRPSSAPPVTPPISNVPGGFVIPKGRAGTIIEPRRITRQPGFAEHHQPGSLLRRYADKLDGARKACVELQESRFSLNDRDLNLIHRAVPLTEVLRIVAQHPWIR